MKQLFAMKPFKVLLLLSACAIVLTVKFMIENNDDEQHNSRLSFNSAHPKSKSPDEIHIDIGVEGALDQFYPLRLTECSFNTPRHYAPCQARSMKHVTAVEELIYPPFTLSPPIFSTLRPQDSELWWNTTWKLRDRAYRLEDRLRYPEKHGQIFVFENVTLSKSTPFDAWNQQACMSSFVPTSFVEPSNKPPTHHAVLLANVPDSWSMQHFLDRSMRVVAQAHAFQTTHIATGRESESSVKDLWSTLGYTPDRMFHSSTDFVAMKLIWSCRAPLMHPWLTRKSLSLIHPASLSGPPIADRKVVLYVTRSNGLIKNPGRRVLNEDLLLLEIQRVIDSRGQGEVLHVFNHEEFGNMTTLMQYLQLNVKAVIGPHGGALHNHFWTGPDTLMLEFQPLSRPHLSFYESAKLRNHAYAVQMLETVDDEHNMIVDIPSAVQILEERLGKEVAQGDKIRAAYDWEAEELGVTELR